MGAYHRNARLHGQVDEHLNLHRRCLIVGKPGRGESALAKAVGYEPPAARKPTPRDFYLSAKKNSSASDWLGAITHLDFRTRHMFILDDCHLVLWTL